MLANFINIIQQLINKPVIGSVFDSQFAGDMFYIIVFGVGVLVYVWFLLLMFIGCVAVFWFLLVPNKKRKKRATQKVNAKIIDKMEHIDSEGTLTYTLALEYSVNGKIYTTMLPVGTKGKYMQIGSTYDNLYITPRKPTETYNSGSGSTLSEIIIGLLSGCIGIFVLVKLIEVIKMFIELL